MNVTRGVALYNTNEVPSGETKGNVTLLEDAAIPVGATLVIPEGCTLTLREGMTLTNNGTIQCVGTFEENEGILTCRGEILYGSDPAVTG